MAIDLGTSSCKVAIVDEELCIRAIASFPFETAYPKLRFAEQDPDDWWRAICKAATGALSSAGNVSVEVIALSSQREGLVILNERFEPMQDAIVWIDRRAVAELDELLNCFGIERIARTTWVVPSAGFTAPLLRWLCKHDRRIIEAARHITQPKGFLIGRLTGEFAIDITLAPRFSLFDMNARRYDPELLDWAGVAEWQMPRTVEPTEVVGGLSDEAASQLGLKSGTPVIAGMGDRQCEALGLSITPMEEVMVASGTAANISVLIGSDKAMRTSAMLDIRVAKGPHIDDLIQFELGLWACGAVLKWLASELGGVGELASELQQLTWVEDAIKRSKNAQSLIVLPFFAGASAPHWDAKVLACIIGLSLGHSACDIVRATVEALAIEIASNVKLYQSAIHSLKHIVHCGGLAQVEPFNKAIADAAEMDVVIPKHHDAAVLGAACLGLSMMLCRDAFELAGELNPKAVSVSPSDDGVEQMRLRAKLQTQAYDAIRHLMHEPS